MNLQVGSVYRVKGVEFRAPPIRPSFFTTPQPHSNIN